MYEKSKLATTSIFDQVGESNRKSPDLTHSSIVFFHLMTQFLFHPDIHGGTLSSTVLLIQFKKIFKEYLIRLKNTYVSTVLFAKHSFQSITLVALKSCWCSSKVFVHREEVQSSGSSLCKTNLLINCQNILQNNTVFTF